jgi:predicted nucleotidyltransferase
VSKADFNTLCEQVAVSHGHMQFLLGEIERHIPKATVWAFGSRVTGQHRPASDLDLAVHCDKETARTDLPRLNEALIESDLPFKVQLLDFDRLPENMQATIKTKYAVLCQPQGEK